jgi:hypothetical protein
MPLPKPILDDRSYQQLRDELVRRIPVYAPEWNDHNPADPGVTFLELFAFLGENLLFRFNQIPETTRLAFLSLLQIPLRPATPAHVLLAFTTEEPQGALVAQRSQAKAGKLPFETQDEVLALPVEARAYCRQAPERELTDEERSFAALAIDARGGLGAGETETYYETRALPLDPAAPDAQPVDFARAVDHMLWVALLAPKKLDAAGMVQARADLAAKILNLGFVRDESAGPIDSAEACPGEGPAAKGPAMTWQVSRGVFDPPGDETGTPVYRTLALAGDTTRGLQQQGVVRLTLPAAADLGDFSLTNPDLRGTGALPPPIEDDDVAARVLFWVRAWRDDQGPLPSLLWVGVNAAEALQVERAQPEFVGAGDGQPGQTFALVHRPLLAGSLRLEVEGDDGWQAWQEVAGFWASGEDDRHYVLDHEAGTVTFGNVFQGAAPQVGRRIRAVEYLFGGGPEGNVPSKAVNKIAVEKVKVSNPLPARLGAPAETVTDALERVPAELRRRDRAVTRGDFQELAYATPGADVGRAECLPLFDPHTKQPDAAGVVSVVVWPREDRQHPSAPLPDRTLLQAVCRWLDARRLVTTELYVIPPTYRKVAASVSVGVKAGYGASAVRRWVELVLRQYLAPLPPYGPEGGGWPLGREVYGPELEAAVLQVEGVQFVRGLRVAGLSADGTTYVENTSGDARGRVALDAWEVPELAELVVVDAGDAPAPGTQPPAPAPPLLVPVPVIREEC